MSVKPVDSTNAYKPTPARKTLKQRDKRNRLAGFIIGVTLTSTAAGAVAAVNARNRLDRDIYEFNARGKTVEQASQYCGIDPRAIIIANKQIDDASQIVYKITVPIEYDALADSYKKIDDKLESDELNRAEKEKLENKKEELDKHKEEQKETVEVYTDGKWVYIIPNEQRVYAEDVKDMFGIKDGIIKKNNEGRLSYDWAVDTNGHGYMDYTSSTIPYNGIKVPRKEIGKDFDIND